MSGLARLMIDRGVAVSGSDMRDSARLETLRRQGADVYIGTMPLTSPPTSMWSSTPRSSPRTTRSGGRPRPGIPVLARSEALVLVMADRMQVIGGRWDHGKTTTTSMITVALQRWCRSGRSPSAARSTTGSNAHTGQGDFVVEADESDGRSCTWTPAVVDHQRRTDHLNHWGTFEAGSRLRRVR